MTSCLWLESSEETKRRYLFVAIDRATRWVFVAVKSDKTALERFYPDWK